MKSGKPSASVSTLEVSKVKSQLFSRIFESKVDSLRFLESSAVDGGHDENPSSDAEDETSGGIMYVIDLTKFNVSTLASIHSLSLTILLMHRKEVCKDVEFDQRPMEIFHAEKRQGFRRVQC